MIKREGNQWKKLYVSNVDKADSSVNVTDMKRGKAMFTDSRYLGRPI